MTSPAQLNYLDAMGIPVWVSRDLIIEHNDVTDEYSKSDPSKLKNEESMQSILDSLMNPDQKEPFVNIQEDREDVEGVDSISELTEEVVVKTRIEPVVENDNLVSTPLPLQDSQNVPHHHVYTSGNNEAEWMVIGHSPELMLNVAYEPFAGDAGVLLDNMLKAVGIMKPREQAYLMNVFDAQNLSVAIPEGGLEASQKLLKQNIITEIEKVKPKVILLVGQIAAQNLLEDNKPLVIMRSKVHQLSSLNIPSIVTYYPSYLLQKPIDKRKAWEDLKLAMSQVS